MPRRKKVDAPEITFTDLHDTTPEEAINLLKQRILWVRRNMKDGDRLTMRNDGEFFYLRKRHGRTETSPESDTSGDNPDGGNKRIRRNASGRRRQ